MPTYVYGCDSCGQQFEKFQKFSDEPVRECPNCGSPVRRVFQPAGIVFKGSGWHVTDYKRNGSNGSEAKDGDSKAGDTKSTDASNGASKSDGASKPAASSGSDAASSTAA
jgi:putative FmdB family regulatory protein